MLQLVQVARLDTSAGGIETLNAFCLGCQRLSIVKGCRENTYSADDLMRMEKVSNAVQGPMDAFVAFRYLVNVRRGVDARVHESKAIVRPPVTVIVIQLPEGNPRVNPVNHQS